VDECPRDTDALSLSSRKSFDETLLLMKKSDSGEDFRYFFSYITVLVPAHFHGKRDILTNGLRTEEFEILKYDSDTSTIREEFLLCIGINIGIFLYEKTSGFRFEVSDEHLDEARLSASGSADEKHEFSRIYGDIGVFQDIFIPVRESDIFYFHERKNMMINGNIIQKNAILQAMFARFFFLWYNSLCIFHIFISISPMSAEKNGLYIFE